MKLISALFFVMLALTALSTAVAAQSPPAFLDFIKTRAAEMRAGETPPASLKDWQKRRQQIRAGLQKAWGDFPKQPAPLNASVRGVISARGLSGGEYCLSDLS